MSERRYKSIRY